MTADRSPVVAFFHDVLCAWCYAASPRVRRLAAAFPELQIVHRSFALAPTPDAIVQIFGSTEAGKREILDHWRAANANDDDHRMRPDLMAQRDFDYPYSLPGLLGCEAARLQAGETGYWDYFDAVQALHLTACENIADPDVIRRCAADIGLDAARFADDLESPLALQSLQAGIHRAHALGIRGVPALHFPSGAIVSGAQPYEMLQRALR